MARLTVAGVGSLLVAMAVAATSAGPQTRAPQQPPPAQRPSEVEVVIRGDAGTPPRMAVPDFVALTPDAAEAARTIGQVLWDDLNFEREFYLIARDTYATIPAVQTIEQIPFPSWRELGADALVFGTVQRTGDTLRVQFRLIDVATGRTALAKEYSGKLKIAKMDVDANTEVPKKYSIRGIPTLMLFKNGNMEAMKVGAMSKSQLTAFLDSNI